MCRSVVSGRDGGHVPGFFLFKVDSQAPRRAVQCLLAYKLTRQTTTDHLKRGCTSTSNSPRDRTPPLQTCKHANKQNETRTAIDCKTTGLTNTVLRQRRKVTTEDTCQQTHPIEIGSPPICNRTNRDQKQQQNRPDSPRPDKLNAKQAKTTGRNQTAWRARQEQQPEQDTRKASMDDRTARHHWAGQRQNTTAGQTNQQDNEAPSA